MNTRKYLLILAIFLFLGAAILLILGSPLLVRPILGNPNLPAGTLITWSGIVALPLIIYTSIPALYYPTSQTMRIYRNVLLGILCLAASWGLVSYLLAGNWNFSFSGDVPGFQGSPKASWFFWRFSYLTGGLPLAFLLLFGAHQFAGWIRRNRLQRKE